MDRIIKRSLKLFIPILSVASLVPLSANASTNYLKGDFDVNGGQVDYQLPIQVAPGRAGHAPTISVSYSSDSPNGILGVGWRVDGLSSVYRCGKNLAIDGKWGGVNLNNEDQYCIDGQRLIAITGNPGENATEYRTRKNDYRKIVSFGNQGVGPEYFKVWSKDGQLYEYGVSQDSRVEVPGRHEVYKWAINRISDITRNNPVDFNYEKDEGKGSHLIKSIDYFGGNVEFQYEERDDTQFSYLAGGKIQKTHRVNSIVTRDKSNQEVASYTFGYKESEGTKRSLLNKIEQCVGEECREPITFTWQSKSKADFEAEKKVFEHDVTHAKFYDFERDGNYEILTLGKHEPYNKYHKKEAKKTVLLNNDASHKLDGSPKNGKCSDFAVADWNGNDKPEFRAFCYPQNSGSLMSYHIGNGKYKQLYTANHRGLDWAKEDHYPIDKNGDGVYELEKVSRESKFYFFGGWTRDSSDYSYYDFNGDGKNTEYLKNKGNGLELYIDGRKVQDIYQSRESDYQLINVVDFNKDGYLDLLVGDKNSTGGDLFSLVSNYDPERHLKHNLYIYYFNGVSFVKSPKSLSVNYSYYSVQTRRKCGGHKERSCSSIYYTYHPGGIRIIDVNSDGFPDIVSNGNVLINNGGTLTLSNNAEQSYLDLKHISLVEPSSFKQLIDINSDGWPDVINGSKVKRSKPFAQDKIIEIHEHGLDYKVHYSPLANSDIYKQEKFFKYPVQSTTPTKYVVSKFDVKPKGYSSTTTKFKYYNAKSHMKGEGFLGFEKIERTRIGINKEKIVTTFEQIDPILAGKVKEVTTYRSNSLEPEDNYELYLKNTYEYSKKEFKGVGAKYYKIFLDSTVETIFSKNDEIEKKTQSNFIYDNFGNLLQKNEILTSDFNSGGKFETSTEYSYLSSGDQKTSSVINITSSIQSSILSKYNNFQMMCRDDGTKYIKPSDEFVLIHGDVSVPILTKRYNEYYKLVIHDSTESDGVSTLSKADFIPVSKAEFSKANSSSCGHYLVIDYDGDGQLELATINKTVTQLITESGDNYWKVSAPRTLTNTITDLTDVKNTLTRKIATSFDYTPNGLVQSELVKPEQYEASNGAIKKHVLTSYTYDEYGNITRQVVSGSGTAARTTSTAYDGDNLFPVSTTNAKGHVTRLEYDNHLGLLIKSISPVKNRETKWSYDVFGRVITENRPGAADKTNYQYSLGQECPDSTTKTVSCVVANNANGAKTVTQYDYAGREIRNMHQAFDGRWVYRDNLWDSDGRKVAVTRPSFKRPDGRVGSVPTVKFVYDERDREILKQEPLSANQWVEFKTQYAGLTTTVTDAKGNEKSITYNLLGHIVHTGEPLGAEQFYINYPDGKLKQTKDAKTNITSIRYDNLGYRTYLDDPDMGEWTYDYNIFGELVKKTDANNVTTVITYDNLGRKIKEAQGKNISVWKYDDKGAGLLSYHYGNGNKREYFYNKNGLVSEVHVLAKGQQLSTKYEYDGFERVKSEERPNGLKLNNTYNPYGYHSAVISPKDYKYDIYSSDKFRHDVETLIKEAKSQAQKYIDKAEEYAVKKSFFEDKAKDYASREIDLHNLDAESISLLKDDSRYKRYCDESGECYLQAAAWVLLHDDVAIPLDVDFDKYFKISSRHTSSAPGRMIFDSSVHQVTKQEFSEHAFGESEEWLLSDYDKNGALDLVSRDNVYGASVDSETHKELIYTSDELKLAAEIANSRYQYYYDLAEKLTSLSEDAGDLSGLYCEDANRLAGDHVANKGKCGKNKGVSQVDHLDTILTQIKLEELSSNDNFIIYWNRQSTDAYDHTLAETLGNGLVNSYIHDQFTGRAVAIASHRANSVVSQRNHLNIKAGQSVRYLRYQYDAHNNVIQRDDLELGIEERFGYDALDRLTMSQAILSNPDLHGKNNPDFNTPFIYAYDELGNIKQKGNIRDYEYNGAQPHAVSKANGVTFTYDSVGNLIKGETGTTKKVVERSLEWNGYNKPTKITRNGHTVEFAYDANQTRYYRKDSTGTETLYFDKLYERITDSKTGEVQHKQFIYADGKLIALNIEQFDSESELKDRQIRFLHYDALESVDLITDGFGLIVERRSFDPWGKARKIQWRDDRSASDLKQFTLTNRGFTGHEHMKEVGLIHMNGRVYDEELGRFLSADPLVQSPYMTNSFNRYSYVWNNPLKYRDPTGFETEETGGKETSQADAGSKGKQTNGADKKGDHHGSKRDGQSASRGNTTSNDTTKEEDTAKGLSDVDEKTPEEESGGFWDNVQDAITGVAIAADFVPVIGTAVSVVLDVANAAGYAIRNKPMEALASLASVPPVAGNYVATTRLAAKAVKEAKLVAKGTPPANLSPPGAGRTGAFKEAKRQSGIPASQQPSKVGPNIDKRGKVQPGKSYEFEVPAKGGGTKTVKVRDDSGGHDFGPGDPQNRGSHFNNEAGDHFDY